MDICQHPPDIRGHSGNMWKSEDIPDICEHLCDSPDLQRPAMPGGQTSLQPSRSCAADLRCLSNPGESRISGRSWLSQLSLESTPSHSSGCRSLPADLTQPELSARPQLTRADSALFLSPFLPYVEIPAEKGLQKYKSILRLAARKARKTLLKRSTHQCTIPEEYRDQLKQIYVY